MTRITEQLAHLEERIENAADRAGRGSQSIEIVAVSKKHPVASIREAQAAGVPRFGENYVQEALGKIAAIDLPVEWHFIGAMQSRKAAAIAAHFDWAHTVATERAARRLSGHRPAGSADLQVCIQLRPDGAPERAGADIADLPALAAFIEDAPGLALRGLMVVPLPGPPGDSTGDTARREYARARRAAEQLINRGHALDTLSMGMSRDLEAAIMEGSTMLRIGTDIFGPRSYDE